jgi:hypothetical protein
MTNCWVFVSTLGRTAAGASIQISHRKVTCKVYTRPVCWSARASVVLLACCSVACAGRFGATLPPAPIVEHEINCARNIPVVSPYRMPLAEPVSDPQEMATLNVLPGEARRTLRAAGLEPLLVKLLRARGQSAEPGQSLRELALEEELTLRLMAFDSQLTSLSFETECTRRHLADVAVTLDSQEGSRQLTLATTSLVVGAGTGISAGLLDLAGSESLLSTLLAVTGGVITAGLGVAALTVPQREVMIDHRHNLLRPIQTGSDPEHFYPSFVFRMLTAQYPGDDTTPRVALRADFERTLEPFGDEHVRAELRGVIFGDGGVYSRALLAAREQMLHRVQFAVQGVARSLELLDRSLVRLLGTPPTAAERAHAPRVQRDARVTSVHLRRMHSPGSRTAACHAQ